MPAICNNAWWIMAPSDHSDQGTAQGVRPAGSDPQQELRPYGADRARLDMFGSPPARNYDPDPESVRAELIEILARARAAPQLPWSAKERSYWRTVFPQMTNWLPEKEANRLRAEFAAEVARLQAA